jgi:hypothetical protein
MAFLQFDLISLQGSGPDISYLLYKALYFSIKVKMGIGSRGR